jgi:hypothetical protein
MARRLNARPDRAFRVFLLLTGAVGAIAFAIAAFLWIGDSSKKTVGPIQAGVTFSAPYARELGLNWRETLTAILDDLDVRHFRIPAYWSIVQPSEGAFDWTETDFEMDEIARRQGSVTLAIGAKLPRWPECWIPAWAASKSTVEEQSARLAYLRATVEKYKDHPALSAWQVENEALFPFGVCPKPDRSFFKKEIELVRSLDPNHPVYTTDSGELSTWVSTGPLVDKLGVSVYRIVVSSGGRIWKYSWIPPYWYARHAALVSFAVRSIYVSEFQMEPWANVASDPLDVQFRTFTPEMMKMNFSFADRMRVPEISFWGVEWWWWMKTKQEDPRFWDLARIYFHSNH